MNRGPSRGAGLGIPRGRKIVLTVKKVDKFLRRGDPGRYFDDQGLYLVVESKRNASWSRRYELNKRAHEIGLGSAKAFTLAEARERNRKISQQLTDGIDPLTAKRAQHAAQAATVAASKTFRDCAETYIADHQASWRSARHGQQWQSTLQQYVYPRLGNLDVAAIGRAHVLDVLEQRVANPAGKFWDVRTITANRVRSRIELVLSWATSRGYRHGDNPARWEDLQHVLPAPTKISRVEHYAAVPYGEVPAVMAELRRREGVAAKAMRFMVLTATRPGETLGATWSEIDFNTKTWTIPAPRMKAEKEHKVPLSPAAIEVLNSLPREAGNDHLFIGARQPSLSLSALTAVMHRLGRSETNHGFRSSFSDWSHEQTADSNHVIEMSLAHSIGNAAEKAYRRTDLFAKRRQLIEQWARYCTSGVSVQKTAHGNVTSIGAGR